MGNDWDDSGPPSEGWLWLFVLILLIAIAIGLVLQ